MSRIKIGWSSKDISTNKPIGIPGQFWIRLSVGLLDSLVVSALCIESDDDMVIFVSGDLCVARNGLLDEIREKVAKLNPDIPTEKIILNATHTHSAPAHNTHPAYEYAKKYSGDIMDFNEYKTFFDMICAEAICEAYETRAEGGIAYGYGYAVASHSRRVVYFDDLSLREGSNKDSSLFVDGHASMYGNTDDPMFSGYEAGSDHFTNMLYTFDSENKLTGAIVNVPCPSQTGELENYLSGDFWHDVRAELREKYGDIHIITQCAAAGDLSPKILHYKKAQDRRFALKYKNLKLDERITENPTMYYARIDIAKRICESFDEVLSWAKEDIKTDIPLSHTVKTIELSKRYISREDYERCKKLLDNLKKEDFADTGDTEKDYVANCELLSSISRFESIISRYEEQHKAPSLPMEMHIVAMGEIAFATNRFELYMDYQHRIQARSPFTQTFIVQLCAQPGLDGGTYLPTERGVWGVGYSASVFCNEASPKGGQELVEESVAELKRLYEVQNK